MGRFLVSVPTIENWEPVEVDTLAEAANMVAEFDEWGCEVTAINPEPGTQACFTREVAELVSADTFRECWEATGGVGEFLERFDLPSWSEDWADSQPLYGREHSTLDHFTQGLGR